MAQLNATGRARPQGDEDACRSERAGAPPPGRVNSGAAAAVFQGMSRRRRASRELPPDSSVEPGVFYARAEVRDILNGKDSRLIVVAGEVPASRPQAAADYVGCLWELSLALGDDLLILPRMSWAGAPQGSLAGGDEDFLRAARGLMRELSWRGIPVACEWRDPATSLYLEDTIALTSLRGEAFREDLSALPGKLPMPLGVRIPSCPDQRIADLFRTAAAGTADCHAVLLASTADSYTAKHVRGEFGFLRFAGVFPE